MLRSYSLLALNLLVKKPWDNCWEEGISRASGSPEEKKQTHGRIGEFTRLWR